MLNGGGSGLVINYTESGITGTLDKTWQEIHDAMAQGKACTIISEVQYKEFVCIVTEVNVSGSQYNVYVSDTNLYLLTCESADAYPTISYQ